MKIIKADHTHENELKTLIKQPMPGWIETSYEREPSFLHSITIEGKKSEAFVCLKNGNVIGMGTRSTKDVWIQGKQTKVGYLGALRLDKAHRSSLALFKGFKYLKKLDQIDPVDFYFTTIVSDNQYAKKILTSLRADLPHYLHVGKIVTHIISKKAISKLKAPFYKTTQGDTTQFFNIAHQLGKRKNLYPLITENDLNTEYLKNLTEKNLFTAFERNNPVGIAAYWDQSSFKQTKLVNYNNTIKYLRHFINKLNLINFEKPGSKIHLRYLSFACAQNPGVALNLIKSVGANMTDNELLVFSFLEDDPTNPHILMSIKYKSDLYFVTWNNKDKVQKLIRDHRQIHIDAGTL